MADADDEKAAAPAMRKIANGPIKQARKNASHDRRIKPTSEAATKVRKTIQKNSTCIGVAEATMSLKRVKPSITVHP